MSAAHEAVAHAQQLATPVMVAGPLHPDLFGGETPIWLPVESTDLRAFDVHLEIQVLRSEQLQVLALSAAQAREIARQVCKPELEWGAQILEVDLEGDEEYDPALHSELVADFRRYGGGLQ